MMSKVKYEVVQKFKDVQDNGKVYQKGDRYPKPLNKKVSEERLNELASTSNKLGQPVIKVIGE